MIIITLFYFIKQMRKWGEIMSNVYHAIFGGLKEAESLYKKISLLEKKKEVMTLTEEEEKKRIKLTIDYFVKCEKIISELVNKFLEQIMDSDSRKFLYNIQKYLHWDGKLLLDTEKAENLIISINNLSSDELEEVKNDLIKLHASVMKNLNEVIEDENNYIIFDNFGKLINSKFDNGVYSFIYYVDSIYRDLSDILGVELDEVIIEEVE
jgi:hypothetical protein